MDTEDNYNNMRVASFSAYLNSADNFVLKLEEAIQDSPPPIISVEETPCPITIGRIKTKETEISVFGADKYFNMKINSENPQLHADNVARKFGHKKEDHRADFHSPKPNFRSGTPSTISESSWNSQTALIPSLLRKSSQNKQKRAIGRRFFLGFGCAGPCLDKKSVCIDGNAEHEVVQGTGPGVKSGEHFNFPVLKSGMENLSIKKQLELAKIDEEQRKSLEVFGSHMMKKGDDIAKNLERKLSMLTWDAIPAAKSFPTTLASSRMCDDIESDASSDLFELENISSTGQYSLLTRQASDNMSSCMTPTTQYAPSEASIEWSVVTASAADFSVASDYDAEHMISSNTSKMTKNMNIGAKSQKGRPSGLLSCKSQKAASVDETAYMAKEKAKSLSIGKPQAETRGRDFEFSQQTGSQVGNLVSIEQTRLNKLYPRVERPHLLESWKGQLQICNGNFQQSIHNLDQPSLDARINVL